MKDNGQDFFFLVPFKMFHKHFPPFIKYFFLMQPVTVLVKIVSRAAQNGFHWVKRNQLFTSGHFQYTQSILF